MLKSSRYHCRFDADLQGEYGPQMTCDAYWTQFYAQDGECAACEHQWKGTPGAPRSENSENRLSVDHRHVDITDGVHGADGPFRGLLCRPCNRLLTEGVTRVILARPDQNVIVLPGGDVVTASQVAYVRYPPAAKLRIWITGRRRPMDAPKKQGKTAAGDKISPYRAHVRGRLRGPEPTRRYVHTRPIPLIDPTAPRPVRVCTCGVAPGIPGRVCMPDWCALHPVPLTRRREPEPEPAPPPLWPRVVRVALLGVGGACVAVLAVIIVVKLLPGLLLLAVTGLIAARSVTPG